ncbi:MAG: hypothetical protein JW841_16065, partial [Deltaproteobacteria bacterium]|nr:hypothetical protein [Deltaproteobacteria bacterium]
MHKKLFKLSLFLTSGFLAVATSRLRDFAKLTLCSRSIHTIVLLGAAMFIPGCLAQSEKYQDLECVQGDASKTCPQGQVCLDDNKCHQLCYDDPTICEQGTECNQKNGLCEEIVINPPKITGIDGDGGRNGSDGESDHYVTSALIIKGENLAQANFTFISKDKGGKDYGELKVRERSADKEVKVDLPVGVAEGNYTLRAANAMGSDEVVIPLLKGDPGVNGTCNASQCTSQGIPDAGRMTVLKARAANKLPTSEASVIYDGNELIGTPVNGIWLGVIDRATQKLVQSSGFSEFYEIIGNTTQSILALQNLISAIDSISVDQMAIIVSRGEVYAQINQVVEIGETSYLLADKLKKIGASNAITGLSSDDAFVLVGYPGMGV